MAQTEKDTMTIGRERTFLRLRVALTMLTALALGGLPASAASARAGASSYWIVLASDRDGQSRAYSVRPDGSRLTPLLPSGHGLESEAHLWVSADGARVAYADRHNAIYIFNADGTGLRRLVRKGFIEGFSPDGKLLAFSDGAGKISIVGADGRGPRRLTTIDDIGDLNNPGPDWSPDGKAVVVATVIDEKHLRYGLVVKPLRGRQRVLVRTGPSEDADAAGIDEPVWSPGGRWIAYVNGGDAKHRKGLWVIRPDGRHPHRLAPGIVGSPTWSPNGRWIAYLTYDSTLKDEPSALRVVALSGERRLRFRAGGFEWSPDGKRLAFLAGSDIAVARVDGRGSKKLGLGGLRVDWFNWSPDGTQLLLGAAAAGNPAQIWVVDSDGRGLKRLTSEGNNEVVGWTRLAPARPPATPLPPNERVLDAATVVTRAPVSLLSADGSRVAFLRTATATDCDHVDVWMPGGESVQRFGGLPAPCQGRPGGFLELALAGSRVAWANGPHSGDTCSYALESATLADSAGLLLADDEGESCQVQDHFHVHGHGDLLVFNNGQRLVRIGAGSEKCDEYGQATKSICATLRRGADAAPVDSVSGGLIAIRKAGAVTVLDEQGKLVRSFPFAPADVYGGRLDGGQLVVVRSYTLESYDVATGARDASQPFPAGYQLADVDGGIAVLRRAGTVTLLRLADGRSLTLAHGDGPMFADLEPPGLYYSYETADGGGRVVFVPRSDVVSQLGGTS